MSTLRVYLIPFLLPPSLLSLSLLSSSLYKIMEKIVDPMYCVYNQLCDIFFTPPLLFICSSSQTLEDFMYVSMKKESERETLDKSC